MNQIFVDTSGWAACADAGDESHEACVRARDKALEAGIRLVTTDYVVDETLTLLRMRLGSRSAAAWWQQVSESRRLRWERIDAGRFERAMEWFSKQKDKTYSFTDCTSFVVMRELRIAKALATDRHFRQAGFEVVPSAERRRGRR
ncbi:MAG: PIN domain-containing protein [Cyanobacteria bacterium]|nr:PIN domain-containing protein [Cyanobacteriota bacterium]